MANKYNFEILEKCFDKEAEEVILKLKCDFVPASRPRVARFGTYIAEPYKTFKKELTVFFKENFKQFSSIFIGFPLSIDISFYKQIPKSYTKKKKEDCLKGGCTTRPDIDNYFKAILDSIDNIFYTDDSYVVELSGRKLYTEQENYLILKINKFNGDKNGK